MSATKMDATDWEHGPSVTHGTPPNAANPNAVAENRREIEALVHDVGKLKRMFQEEIRAAAAEIQAAGGPLEDRIESVEEDVGVLREQCDRLMSHATGSLMEPLDGSGGAAPDNSRMQAARRAHLYAHARLLTAKARQIEQDLARGSDLEDRLVELEEKVEALLTQDHAVSRWGRRIEASIESLESRVDKAVDGLAELHEELPARVRGTTRLDPEAPNATLTELMQTTRLHLDSLTERIAAKIDGGDDPREPPSLQEVQDRLEEIETRLEGHDQALERLDNRDSVDRRSL